MSGEDVKPEAKVEQPAVPPATRKSRGLGRNLAGFVVGVALCSLLVTVAGVYSGGDDNPEVAPVAPELVVQSPNPVAPRPNYTPKVVVSETTNPELGSPKTQPIVMVEQAPDATMDGEAGPAVRKSVFDTVIPSDTDTAEASTPATAPADEPADKPEPKIAEAQPEPEQAPEVLPTSEPEPAPVAQLKPVENLKPVEQPKSSEILPATPIKTAENLLPIPEPVVNDPVVENAPQQPTATEPVVIAEAEVSPTPRKSKLPVVTDTNSENSNSFFGKRASTLPSVSGIGVSKPLIPQDGLTAGTGSAVAKRLKVPQSSRTAPTTTGNDGASADVAALPGSVADPAPVERAIEKNAVAHDTGSKPVMSIILIDVGNNGAPLNSAATLELPLTFAVPVDRKDAALAATRYAQNGHEVLALSPRSVQMSLSGGQSQEQVTALLDEFFEILPTSVGLLDVSEATLQNDRVLSKYVMRALSASGHGLVTYDQGLNVAKREADKIGVPASLVYRVLDEKGEAKEVIGKHLDRAATEAQRRGHVLVIGTTREDTIQAVLKWSESRAAQSVAIAPVSATMQPDI
jgi:polysaccharide deacetylase 2 family uncharacterized protein YibQ